MAKKDKKGKTKEVEPPEQEVQDEALLGTTDLEPEPEEVQFTDTSYTSASFESLPPVIEEPKPKRKKGLRGKKSEVIEAATKASDMFQWSEESLQAEEPPKVEEEQRETRKKKKKGKKEKVVEEIPVFEKAEEPK